MCRAEAEEAWGAQAGNLWGVSREKKYSLSRDAASWAVPVFRKHYLAQVMRTAPGMTLSPSRFPSQQQEPANLQASARH